MNMTEDRDRDISERAEIVRNWEDFLYKYMTICNDDEYDGTNNPKGYINLATAVNNMCLDIIHPRLLSAEVWGCNTSLLQYSESYGIIRLRKAMAAVMTKFFNSCQTVDPEDLVCFTGVTSCLDVIAHCLADPGEAILVPTPVYGRIYTNFMQRSQVKLWPIPIITHDSTEFSPELTIEKVKSAYDSALEEKQVVKAILIVNPHNPLGDVYSAELLNDIFSFCNEYKLHAIVDEIYGLSIFNGSPNFHSALAFSELPDKNKVHVLYGISKDFGIAGLRVGVIHTYCEALKNCLRQLAFFQSIAFPVMDITAKFLEDLDWCQMYVTENQKRLSDKFKSCVERLKKAGLDVRDSKAGFFLWVDFRPICGSTTFDQEEHFFKYLMDEAKLFIVPGKELFCEQPGWFRLTFTPNPDRVDEGLNRLEEALKTYTKLES